MDDVKIDVQGFERTARMLGREEMKVKLIPPETTTINKRKCMVIHRTLNLPSKNIGITPKEETEKVLESIQKNLVLHKMQNVWSSRGEVCKRKSGGYMCNQELKDRRMGFVANISWKENCKVEDRKDST